MELKDIKTERLFLRRFEERDIPDIAKYGNDKEIHDNTLTVPFPYTEEDARKFYEKCRENYFKEDEGFQYIVEDENGFIGVLGVHKPEKNVRVELGYWMGKEFRGRGYMSEALEAVSNYLLKEHIFERVYLMTFMWNKASSKVAEKAGFSFEGVLRHYAKKDDGTLIDVNLYSKINE